MPGEGGHYTSLSNGPLPLQTRIVLISRYRQEVDVKRSWVGRLGLALCLLAEFHLLQVNSASGGDWPQILGPAQWRGGG